MEHLEYLTKELSVINDLSNIGYILKGLLGLSSIYGIYHFIKDLFSYKTIHTSIGTFQMKRKDVNIQNLTNIISAHFYDGGKIPDNVRKEIIELTMPKIKKLQKTI